MYVPALYDVEYNEDDTIKAFIKKYEKAPDKVKKQVEVNLSEAYYPTKPLVPFIKTTQDRVVLRFKGGIRGCRFCQAGMVYRPTQEKET